MKIETVIPGNSCSTFCDMLMQIASCPYLDIDGDDHSCFHEKPAFGLCGNGRPSGGCSAFGNRPITVTFEVADSEELLSEKQNKSEEKLEVAE